MHPRMSIVHTTLPGGAAASQWGLGVGRATVGGSRGREALHIGVSAAWANGGKGEITAALSQRPRASKNNRSYL